jgi:adenylosuccinate synthase
MKYIQNGKCAVLVDGQFGSTGKGLLAAYLAGLPENRVNIATTNASANAGHWTKYKDPAKRDFCCYHLPTFGVVQPNSEIYLNAGSVINPQLLFKEMIECGVDRTRVTIHPNAAIITQGDIDEETHPQSNATRISSTRKGVGASGEGLR